MKVLPEMQMTRKKIKIAPTINDSVPPLDVLHKKFDFFLFNSLNVCLFDLFTQSMKYSVKMPSNKHFQVLQCQFRSFFGLIFTLMKCLLLVVIFFLPFDILIFFALLDNKKKTWNYMTLSDIYRLM